jgi:hypothetical protein
LRAVLTPRAARIPDFAASVHTAAIPQRHLSGNCRTAVCLHLLPVQCYMDDQTARRAIDGRQCPLDFRLIGR